MGGWDAVRMRGVSCAVHESIGRCRTWVHLKSCVAATSSVDEHEQLGGYGDLQL